MTVFPVTPAPFSVCLVLKTLLILKIDRHIYKPFNLSLDIWQHAYFAVNFPKLH